MENFEIWTSVLVTAVPLLATIVTFSVKLVKSVKNGRAEQTRRLWLELAQDAVQYVETLKGKQNAELAGETKKEIAMSRIESACFKSGIAFEKDKVSALIEDVVALSKKVNGRDKDRSDLAVA